MPRRKMIWIAVLVLVVAFVVCFVLLRKEPQTVRLANGTELTFLAITHGQTNSYLPGGTWQKLVNRFAPTNGINLGPIKLQPVPSLLEGLTWGQQVLTNRAVVWIGHRGSSNAPPIPDPRRKWYSHIRATLADESGEEWEGFDGSFHSTTLRTYSRISSWRFVAFPRRGATLSFRLYTRDDSRNEWQPLVDFDMPNPTPGPYPVWGAPDLPISRKHGDLEVSLVRLTSGSERVPWASADFEIEMPFTRATFEVTHRGKRTEAWMPDRIQAIDATGNVGMLGVGGWGATNGLVYFYTFGGNLNPSEVWKFQTRFADDREVAPAQMWTSTDLAVVAGGLLPIKLTTNWHSYSIKLECQRLGPHNYIRVEFDPPPIDARVRRPVEAIDDQGRSVEAENLDWSDSRLAIQPKIPPGANSIRLSIGLAETRTLEFVARPVREGAGNK